MPTANTSALESWSITSTVPPTFNRPTTIVDNWSIPFLGSGARPSADPRVSATVRNVALIVCFAGLTALANMIRIPSDPVPFTGQTFGVLLAGGALGARRGFASQLIYVVGTIGWRIGEASQADGWAEAAKTILGASTVGYLLGFVLAAYLVGLLAEKGQDKSALTSIPAFLTGTVVIYVCGAVILAAVSDELPLLAGSGTPSAISEGVAPFLVWDLAKAVAAGLLLPAAWKLTKEP